MGSSMLARTVMIVGLLSVAAQVTYSMCENEISVKVLIFIPPEAKIGECSSRNRLGERCQHEIMFMVCGELHNIDI